VWIGIAVVDVAVAVVAAFGEGDDQVLRRDVVVAVRPRCRQRQSGTLQGIGACSARTPLI
jgi:hypothetical protein